MRMRSQKCGCHDENGKSELRERLVPVDWKEPPSKMYITDIFCIIMFTSPLIITGELTKSVVSGATAVL